MVSLAGIETVTSEGCEERQRRETAVVGERCRRQRVRGPGERGLRGRLLRGSDVQQEARTPHFELRHDDPPPEG